jgi:hypothetical protein
MVIPFQAHRARSGSGAAGRSSRRWWRPRCAALGDARRADVRGAGVVPSNIRVVDGDTMTRSPRPARSEPAGAGAHEALPPRRLRHSGDGPGRVRRGAGARRARQGAPAGAGRERAGAARRQRGAHGPLGPRPRHPHRRRPATSARRSSAKALRFPTRARVGASTGARSCAADPRRSRAPSRHPRAERQRRPEDLGPTSRPPMGSSGRRFAAPEDDGAGVGNEHCALTMFLVCASLSPSRPARGASGGAWLQGGIADEGLARRRWDRRRRWSEERSRKAEGPKG